MAAAETVAMPARDGAQKRDAATPPVSSSGTALVGATCVGKTFGTYEVLEELGHGGMGSVYRARQPALGRVVALKMIRAGELADAGAIARFRAEAEAVAQLDHPNIVPIYEVGTHHGQYFFAMKLIEGLSLARALARGAWPGSASRPEAAARLVATLARAVHYTHQRGILHRDLKPANVLLDQHAQPYITDFGVARRLDTPAGLTVSGAIIGTPSYMAPEQALAAGPPTTAVDVYGLGAILYELLTGRPPFKAATALDTLLQVRCEEPVRPRALCVPVDRDLETICLKCLSKRAANRYGSAEALAEDLEHWLAHEPIRARPVGAFGRLAKWAQRRPALAATYGLLLLASVLAAGGALATSLWLDADDKRRRTAEALQIAEQLRDMAETSRQREVEARTALARVSYQHRVNLAHQGFWDGNLGQSRRLLADCPAALRGWEWRYLDHLCQNELLALQGGQGCGSRGLVWDASGDMLAVATGYQRTALIYDTLTGRLRHTLPHPGRVHSVALHPDGRLLATSCDDGNVRVWDGDAGTLQQTLAGHKALIHEASFSRDGRLLASCSDDRTIWIWDTATWQRRRVITGPAELVCLGWSPDGQRLAGGAKDHSVRLWQLDTGSEERLLGKLPYLVASLAFAPDGKRLAAGSWGEDGTIKLWNIDTGAEAVTILGHQRGLRSIAFSPDGERLASGGQDSVLRIWDSHSGQLVNTLRGHSAAIMALAWTPDGRRLATQGHDRAVKVWDATRPQEALVLAVDGKASALAFTPDSRTLTVAADTAGTVVFDAATGQRQRLLQSDGADSAVAWNPDGQQLARAGSGRTVRVFIPQWSIELFELQATASVRRLAYTADSKLLAAACADGSVDIWNAPAGQRTHTLAAHTGPAAALSFSPDSSLLATGSVDHRLKIWSAATGELRRTLEPQLEVNAVAFAPDSKRLACAVSGEDAVMVWDLATGQRLAVLRGHIGPVMAVCYSPDGTRLASASTDKSVKIWDAAEGQELLTLKGHAQQVVDLVFSPDGRRLASAGSYDRTVRLWSIGATPGVHEELSRLEQARQTGVRTSAELAERLRGLQKLLP